VATVKLDGTSCTVAFDEGVKVYGRNFGITEGDNMYWRAVRSTSGIFEALNQNHYLALQGEIVGPGVQKNKLGLPALRFVCFDVFNRNTGEHLPHREARALCEKHSIPMAPVQLEGEHFSLTLEEVLELADGVYHHIDGVPVADNSRPGTSTGKNREGLVFRATDGRKSDVLGGRLSFKVISNRFLLKEED
jgi:RNA ligase (TIGR02306 family)